MSLVELYGNRWKLEHEPGSEDTRCPWHIRIVCRYGFISPSGGDLLWACATKHVAKMLVSLCAYEWFTLKQEGTREAAVEFDVDHIDQIALILKPVRK